MSAAHTPGPVTANGELGGNVAITCDIGDSVAHFWLDPKTMRRAGDVLYVNPKRDADARRSKTVRRNCAAKANRPLVDAMMREAPAAIAAWRKARADAEHKAERARQEREAAERLAKAAPQLAEALLYADNCCAQAGIAPDDAPRSRIRAALTAAGIA